MKKYPSTLHVTFSPGLTRGNKKAPNSYFDDYLKGRRIILTEKMDGENSCITRSTAYSRSHTSPANSPWNKNLWNEGSRLYNLRSKLGESECIFGENTYAEHSIHYDKLNSDFYMFSACRELEDGSVQFYNWDDTLLMSEVLNIPTVPIIADRIFMSEGEFKSFIEKNYERTFCLRT